MARKSNLEKAAAPLPIRRSAGLTEEVYARIRADIMSLKIPPDTRIPVDSLVRELGVSQTPIREALSMLEASGLVTKRHFIGYCTAPKLNRAQFEELFEIRLLLEPYAARRAAEMMEKKSLLDICSVAEGMEAKHANKSHASYNLFADQDSDFHARIALGSGNGLITDTLSRLHTHLHIFRLRFHGEVTSEAYVEHARITRALRERDPDGAETAMRAHLEKSYERLVRFVSG